MRSLIRKDLEVGQQWGFSSDRILFMEHFAGYKMSALVLTQKLDSPAPA